MAALKRISLHLLELRGRREPSELLSSYSSVLPPSLFSSRRNMARKIFVGGLPKDFNRASLREAFEPFGEIVEANVPMNRENRNLSLGYGFVTFSKKEDGERAMVKMNGKLVDGCRVEVHEAWSEPDYE